MLPAFIALMLAGAAGFARAGETDRSVGLADADLVSSGARVYAAQRCLRCHALAGEGNRRYPLDGVGSRLDAAQLRNWIIGAVADPARLSARALAAKRRFASLPALELNALVAYLQTQKQAPP
jgi:mono/diheme cytochrome c family protein